MDGTIFRELEPAVHGDRKITEIYGGVVHLRFSTLEVVVYCLFVEVGCFILGVFIWGKGGP